MIPESLKSYLITCKDQHLTWEIVLAELAKSGWSQEVLTSAQNWYSSSQVPTADTPTPPSAIPTSQVNTSVSTDPPPHKSKFGLVIGIFLAIFLLLGSVVSVSAYLVATDKITLNNPTLKRQISQIVFSLPFIPKTPKYVLQRVGEAHKELSRGSFDFSLAVTGTGDSLSSLIGSNNFDISLKGYSDYSDLKNPRASFSVLVSKEFGFDIKKPDSSNLYLKVNKVPLFLLAVLGISDVDKLNSVLTENWVKIDTSTLDTEARQYLGTGLPDTSTQSSANQAIEEAISKLIREDILPALVMTSEKLDDVSVYKIQFKPTSELLDKIVDTLKEEAEKANPGASNISILGVSTLDKKASDYVKDLVVNMFVDQKNFYVKRGDIAMSVTSSTSFSLAGVLKLSDFGTVIPIDAPDKSVTPEELYQQLFSGTESPFGSFGMLSAINPVRKFSQANNTKRRSDVYAVLNAVHQYAADHQGTLPPGITITPQNIAKSAADICSSIVPNYMAALPKDSVLDGGSVSDCSSNYETGYTINISSTTNRVTVSAPMAELEEVISITR